MARRVQVLLEDDLDGTELGTNGETVSFGLDGTTYEIDLSDKNAKALRDAFGRYVQHARKAGRASTGGHGSRRGATGSRPASSETKAARAWLVENGFLSADSRGRISADNWERYHSRGQMTTADVKAETGGTGGKGEAPKDEAKAPRGNSTKAAKAAAGTSGTPEPKTDGVASLLP